MDEHGRTSMPEPAATLTTEQLAQALRLPKRADSVELKRSVPDELAEPS